MITVTDLINRSVTHKTFGIGNITNATGSDKKWNLTVQFKEKECIFVFPACINTFLFTDDKEIIELADIMCPAVEPTPNPPKGGGTDNGRGRKTGPIGHGSKAPRGGWYRWYEENYPGYIILQYERFMYAAHRKSAEELGDAMNYKIHWNEDGEAYTGGPSLSIIAERLQRLNVKYIALIWGEVEEKFDGR